MQSDRETRRAGWRLLRAAVRPHRKWSRMGVAAGLVWTAARVAVPALVGIAVDRGIVEDRPGALVRWIAVILAVGLVQAIATGLRRYAAFRLALRVETDVRMDLVAHVQRLHFAFHDQAQTGQLMARANTDIAQINNVVLLIPLTIASTLTMVAVVVVLAVQSPGLAFFALAGLPLLNAAATRFSRRMFPIGVQLQQELGQLSSVVEESVTGVRVVKGFGSEARQIRRLDEESADVFEWSMAAARLRAWFLPLIDLLPTLGLVGILWFGGHQVLDGNLTVGDITTANLYVLMMIWPLRMLGMLLGQIPRAVASAARIGGVLATDPLITDRPGARPLPPGGGELRFEGVRFAYALAGEAEGAAGPEGRTVLDGLDLVVPAGQAVAVVGATASGKSTLARLIPRFYDVLDGAVRIDGVDVREMRVSELRRSVGIVFEDTFLFSERVRDNIAFADPDAPMAQVERAARLAGAHEFIERLPEGYDTIVGQHGFTLSGGQRQRIAIARAVLSDPRVLILDDATSSVDPSKEHEIRAALREVMRGRTTIIIAHRPATIALADRVVLLDGGRVVADGTHEQLLAGNDRYREVLARAELADAGDDSGADSGAIAPAGPGGRS